MDNFFYWSGVTAWTVSVLFLIFAYLKTRHERRENSLEDEINEEIQFTEENTKNQ